MTTTALDTENPEFTIAIRGYDRVQVDAYIAHLQQRMSQAEQRARDAEAEYVFDQHASIGPRISEIFSLAENEARELRESVSHERSALLTAAKRQADEMLENAERTTREMQQRARQDYETMVAEFERDRDRIRDEAIALEQHKSEALGELRRLRDLIDGAAGVITVAELGAGDTGGDGRTIEMRAITG